jgi:hypothetical protein
MAVTILVFPLLVMQYIGVCRVEMALLASEEEGPYRLHRSVKVLPVLAAVGALGAGLGWLAMFGSVLVSSVYQPDLLKVFVTGQWLFAHIGALALALGVGCLISHYPRQWASLIGVVGGGLLVLVTLYRLLFLAG